MSAFPASNPFIGVSSTFDYSLVDENPDTAAPVCTVISSTVSSCPSRRSSCSTKTYSAEFEIVDEQSGLHEIRPSDSTGNWSIPALSQSTSGARIRVAGTLSCCDSAKLIVLDRNGLMTTCDIQVKVSSAPVLKILNILTLSILCTLILRLIE